MKKAFLCAAAAVMLALALVMVGMGQWQWGKYQLEDNHQRLQQLAQTTPPLALATLQAQPGPHRYRWVELHGRFLNTGLLWDNQIQNGRAGLAVVWLFEDVSQLVVPVITGWVPQRYGAEPPWRLQHFKPPAGLLKLSGRVFDIPRQVALAAESEPELWQVLAPKRLEHISGRILVPNLLIWQQQPSPQAPQQALVLPLASNTKALMHLAYALQWWLFATATLLALLWLLLNRKR